MNTSTIYQSNPSFPDKIHLLHSVVEKIESTYFRLDICGLSSKNLIAQMEY